MSLARFLGGRAPRPNPRAPKPVAPVVARLLALPLAERRDFFNDRISMVDWWMRGRMMSAPGYVDEAEAPWEERTLAAGLRYVLPLLLGSPADPAATVPLFRAVVADPATFPPGADWRDLAGRTWRTALRPVQSWTDSLDSARHFARSASGQRYLAPGLVQFVVEAAVPQGQVLGHQRELEAALRDLALGAAKLDTRARAPALAEKAAYYYRVVHAKAAQREVIVDLPRGEAFVTAVHAVDGPGAPAPA